MLFQGLSQLNTARTTGVRNLKYCIYGISGILLSTAIFLVIIEVPAEAQAVRADFRDSLFFTTSNNVGVETNFNFTIDTQILVGDATLHVGETTTFDYTQTYSMTTDPTVLGLTRGAPEMVPANLFPTESAPSVLDRLYPKHFEHDLFAECCVRFSGLSSATLKTNSPAAGGLNSITIGPVGIGGGTATGDTSYNFHQTPTQTFLDWVTNEDRGGFFFNGGSINFKGELTSISEGKGALVSRNSMWLSAHNTNFPLYILTSGQDVLYEKGDVVHSVALECLPVPEPSTNLLFATGVVVLLTVRQRSCIK